MIKHSCLLAAALLLVACNREPAPVAAAPAAQPAAPTPSPAAAPVTVADHNLGSIAPALAQVFTDGHWGFGGEGTIGNATLDPITVKGVAYPNGIGTVPASNGTAHVVYLISHHYTHFTGQVALNDTSNHAATAVTFRIAADGRELWRSPPMASHGDPASFDVNITSADHLELFVDCPGSNNEVHSVWLNPVLKF